MLISHSGSPPQRVQRAATVDLLSGSDIQSFVDAVESANAVDIPSILGFRIFTGNISQPVGDAFAEFIMKHRAALRINHLEIHHAEEFLGSAHRLVYAFAACTTVTHLTLDEVGDHGRELLVKSRFSLASANLTMPDLDEESDESISEEDDSEDDDSDDSKGQRDPDYYARHNPIILLRNSRRTLVSLTGSGCKTLCAKAKTIQDLSYKQVYPRVTSLELHQCNEVPFVFRLVNAFPNLRTLHVSFALDAMMEIGETPKSFRERRHINQDKQRVFGTWTSLEACRAPLLEHYLLGLTCNVQALHIIGDHMDLDMFAQVLRSTQPARLGLDGFDADLLGPGFAKALLQFDNAQSKLQSLEISLAVGSVLCPDEIEIDVAKTLEDMTSALQPLRIRSFSLSIRVSLHGKPRPPSQLVAMCAQERYLEGLDLDALAAHIRTSVPSLLTVSVRLSGHPTRPSTTSTLGAEGTMAPLVCESSSV